MPALFERAINSRTREMAMSRSKWASAFVALAVVVGAGSAHAQSMPDANEERRPTPHPTVVSAGFQEALENGTRTPTGEPGPNYWQQSADYVINARLLMLAVKHTVKCLLNICLFGQPLTPYPW